MKTALNDKKNNHPEVAGISLKHQLANIQAQVTTTQVQSHLTSAHMRGGSAKAEHQPVGMKVGRQLSLGGQTATRPRPWYCFCRGEDGHLALNCESEPNPLLVEEKRQLLREKQQRDNKKHHRHPAVKPLEAPVAGQTGTVKQSKCPRKTKRVISKCTNAETALISMPARLVGTKCNA